MGMASTLRDFIRRVVNKLLPRDDVNREMGVQIAVSSTMDNAIDLWKNMYENNPPWAQEEGVVCTHLPATMAEEMARLVLTEFDLSISGGPMADFIAEQLKIGLRELDQHVESYCAKGGIALKPYVTFDSNGNPSGINIDFVDADKFYPTAYDSNGEVTSAIFAQSKRIGDYLYTRLEYQQLDGTTLTVMNKAFKSNKIATSNENDNLLLNMSFANPVPLSEVPEWEGISEEPVVIENVMEPLFTYIKVPKGNNIDNGSPLGVSIYARAEELCREADKLFGEIVWEYDAKQAALDVGTSYLKTDSKGKPVMSQGEERLYRTFDDEAHENGLFNIYSPEIRDSSYFNGLNRVLKRLEWTVGFSYGTISDPDMIEKTAEEIRSSKQRSYANVSRIQEKWDEGLQHLVRSMATLTMLYGIVPYSAVEVKCTWGDGVLEDADKEYQRRWDMVTAGKLKPEKFLAWYFNCDEETAREMIPPDDFARIFSTGGA